MTPRRRRKTKARLPVVDQDVFRRRSEGVAFPDDQSKRERDSWQWFVRVVELSRVASREASTRCLRPGPSESRSEAGGSHAISRLGFTVSTAPHVFRRHVSRVSMHYISIPRFDTELCVDTCARRPGFNYTR
jgi:hypothetical protein